MSFFKFLGTFVAALNVLLFFTLAALHVIGEDFQKATFYGVGATFFLVMAEHGMRDLEKGG